MSKAPKLRNFAARYHRNGICGEGFYCCEFDYEGDHFVAMVSSQTDGFYGVCTPSEIRATWRGDWFIDAIRAEIAKIDAHTLA